MPAASENVWNLLHTLARYLIPLLAFILVLAVLGFLLSEFRSRRERERSLPGFGTVGEMIVLSGGRHLDANTWFPVPREGVLGAIRSCDLVVPCAGVRARHLDFIWKDGTGLLIYPRSGCEVLIDGTPVSCRNGGVSVPMIHGSVLQVGEGVLRLHLFAALDHTVPASNFPPQTENDPVQRPESQWMTEPAPVPVENSSFIPAFPGQSEEKHLSTSASLEPDPPVPDAVRPRRSDRWKEEFGE